MIAANKTTDEQKTHYLKERLSSLIYWFITPFAISTKGDFYIEWVVKRGIIPLWLLVLSASILLLIFGIVSEVLFWQIAAITVMFVLITCTIPAVAVDLIKAAKKPGKAEK